MLIWFNVIRSYLPWFEVFFRLLNYVADIMNCSTDKAELCDVELFLEHLQSADISKPLHLVDITLPTAGLVRS